MEKDKKTLENKHKDIARESLEYYKEMKERCSEQWREITLLESKAERNTVDNDKLEQLKHCFTLTVSADYQMQKLVPFWGSSPQPGSTYYLQKLSYDIFGIVDHRDESSAVYIFDERVGTKTADHTISYIISSPLVKSLPGLSDFMCSSITPAPPIRTST